MSEQARVNPSQPIAVTTALLSGWPLPRPDSAPQRTAGRGKESRGTTLVIGGSLEVPGAIILAGIAALRAGTGKLQIATCRDVAGAVAMAVPEARVLHLPQSGGGDIDPSAAERLAEAIRAVPAVVIGPGMLDVACVRELLHRLLPEIADTALVIDAAGLACITEDRAALRHLDGAAVLTPHTLELALMLGIEEEEVVADPLGLARRAAADTGAVVALKGATTYIVTPHGAAYCHVDGPSAWPHLAPAILWPASSGACWRAARRRTRPPSGASTCTAAPAVS
jgi:NAD(P)H-hydrate repair Nnr-like enzyme with NAD(P)H-hydrate dehydratase domain